LENRLTIKDVGVGDLVKVGKAYAMDDGWVPDDWTGSVCTIVDVRPSGDCLLVRGDVVGATAGDWDVAIICSRLEMLRKAKEPTK
jgi:hypothetical protein